MWNEMWILKKEDKEKEGTQEREENEFIISQERPVFFSVDNFPFQIAYLHNRTLKLNCLEKVSNFYTENNLMLSGNMNRVTPADLLKFINLDAELVIIKNKREILGSILSILFPICVNTNLQITDIVHKNDRYCNIVESRVKSYNNIVFANTTFLNNHKKYRGKGIGMVLIQKSLQIAYDEGVLCAYFLNSTARCKNAVAIKNWIYPINPDELDKLHIDYPRKYRSSYTITLTENYDIILVNKENMGIALELYLKLVKDKKFYFNPGIKYWEKWITNHKTYIVKIDDEEVGIFSINKILTYIPNKNCEVRHGSILICVGQQPATIRSLIFTCRKEDFDLLMLQEVGDINSRLLSNIWAIYTDTKDYLNFYNTRITLLPSEIYSPLL